jgi:hypothetical protein
LPWPTQVCHNTELIGGAAKLDAFGSMSSSNASTAQMFSNDYDRFYVSALMRATDVALDASLVVMDFTA